MEKMHFLLAYIRQRKIGIFVFFLFCFIFLCVFILYHLPVGAVLYPTFLCMGFGAIFLLFDIRRVFCKHRQLLRIQELSSAVMEHFPIALTIEDKDYQNIIHLLQEEQRQLEEEMNLRYINMIDYYSVWAHQIKTPIASMRLNLQKEDSELSRKVSQDLFRIEQYVEMVLMFLRLDSNSTDYVLQEYDLDTIIKQAVRKFAMIFIQKKIKLNYRSVNLTVLTDEKWLLFIIEQVLSNALKYTQIGEITIEEKEPKILCIHDTGIGIAPEDLPRIFEKGYTGFNGRSDKKASGLGLYLCQRICKNLGHTITVKSSLKEGTTVYIELQERKLEAE